MAHQSGKNHDPRSRQLMYAERLMAQLHPCPSCQRHARVTDDRCPFCDHALAFDDAPHALPARRLGRAALVAFGATLAVSLAATSCSSDSEETGTKGTGGSGGSSTGGSGGSGGASMGGTGGNTGGTAGAATGGSAGAGTGGAAGSAAGGTAGNSSGGFAGNVAPPYGIPPDPDAG